MTRLIQEVCLLHANDFNGHQWLLVVEPAWLTPKGLESVEARLELSGDPKISGDVLRIYPGSLANHAKNIEDMAFTAPLVSHFYTEGFLTEHVWMAYQNDLGVS
jgi:hypothetical protein